MSTIRSDFKQLLLLAAPLLVGQLAIIGLSITDIVLSGHVSRDDLAGVMLGATLFDLPMMFVLGIFIASSSLAGRLHGRGDREGVNRHFQNSLWLALPVGLVAALAVTLMRLYVLPELEASAAVKAVASAYLVPMTGSAFLLPLVMALRTTLDATGHPRIAMAFNLGGFFANIPLDYVFINGVVISAAVINAFFHTELTTNLALLAPLGGAGCGWATLLVIALIIVGELVYIHRAEHLDFLHIRRRLQPPDWRSIGKIFTLGAPMGGAILAEAGFFHVIPLMVAQLGTLALAAHAVAMSFDMTMFMVPLALAQALTIKTAHLLGAENERRAHQLAVNGIKLGLMIGLIQALIVFVVRDRVAHLYTADMAVAGVAASLLLIACGIRIFDALHIVGTGIMRGYGDTGTTLIISIAAFWLLGAPLAWWSASGNHWLAASAIEAVWLAIFVAVICASAMTLFRVSRLIAHR
ncbi:MAG: MATE family efflux transporter [Porticoccaceae bacterium]